MTEMPGVVRKKYNKFHNIKTVVDGITFSSKVEARRYGELILMQQGGMIEDLRLQYAFRLVVNGKLICRYICDFTYIDTATSLTVIEDVKGSRVTTSTYAIKKKLMLALYGIVVSEIRYSR